MTMPFFKEQHKQGENQTRNPVSPPQSPPKSPERNSAYLPEKSDHVVSPDMTARSPSPSGLEAIASDDETLKEAASPSPEHADKEFYDKAPPYKDAPPPLAIEHPAIRSPQSKSRNRRRLLAWILAAGIVAVILAIALGVGLGVGLKKGSNRNPQADKYLSTVGAYNGSGIALASQSFDVGAFGSIVMYFQHHTGQIRSAQLDNQGKWQGGDATTVVATDAKNGTPIAAVAYARNETAKWHIYYINTGGTISEVVNSNKTNVWVPGPINNLALRPIDDPNVGLQACWYGSFYSDVKYSHSPVPGQSPGPVSDSDQTIGIHLWYGSDPTTFNSYAWIYGDTVWTQQQEFKGYNAHAGVGCYSWGPGSDTYVFFVDLENNVKILWKDLNISDKATPDHPVHQWVTSNVSIPVYANSSLGYTNYLYAQNTDLSFSGYNISFNAEKTTAPTADSQHFVVDNGAKGLPGSHLSVTALPDTSGGNSLLAFFQTNGSDVTEFVRDFEAGQWTSSPVPIPDA